MAIMEAKMLCSKTQKIIFSYEKRVFLEKKLKKPENSQKFDDFLNFCVFILLTITKSML